MGNYSGTIRCGHCYNEGHNRAGCEKLTEQYVTQWARVAQAGYDDDNYTHKRAREAVAKRTGSDPITGESKRKRRATYGGRKCSYCSDAGHTRRTCQSMKADKVTYRALTVASRANLIESMRKHGFGPGSLLTAISKDWEDGEYKTRTIPMIVKSINWDMLHQKTWTEGSAGPECVTVLRMHDNRTQNIMMPQCVTGNDSNWNKVELAGKVPAVEPPAGWPEASSLDFGNVELFETGKARDYYFWQRHAPENS